MRSQRIRPSIRQALSIPTVAHVNADGQFLTSANQLHAHLFIFSRSVGSAVKLSGRSRVPDRTATACGSDNAGARGEPELPHSGSLPVQPLRSLLIESCNGQVGQTEQGLSQKSPRGRRAPEWITLPSRLKPHQQQRLPRAPLRRAAASASGGGRSIAARATFHVMFTKRNGMEWNGWRQANKELPVYHDEKYTAHAPDATFETQCAPPPIGNCASYGRRLRSTARPKDTLVSVGDASRKSRHGSVVTCIALILRLYFPTGTMTSRRLMRLEYKNIRLWQYMDIKRIGGQQRWKTIYSHTIINVN